MHLASQRLPWWPMASCALFLLPLGCDDGFEVSYNGRVRVAEGDFRVLTTLNAGREEFALLVDRESEEQPLVLAPFGDGETCAAPAPAAAFYAVQSLGGPRIAVYDSPERPRALQFIDERCQPHLDRLEQTTTVRFELGFFLIETDDGKLYAMDPWEDRQALISDKLVERGSVADSKGGASIGPDSVWVLEGDQLVLRSLEGAVITRRGHGVTDVAMNVRRQAMAYSDREGVYRLGPDGSRTDKLSEPGCQLRFEQIYYGGGIAEMMTLYSPCDERRLVTILPDDSVEYFPEHVIAHFRRQALTSEGIELWTVFIVEPEDSGERRYFVSDSKGSTSEIDVPVSGSSLFYRFGQDSRGESIWLLITADEESRLGTWQASRGFSEIAPNVSEVVSSPAGLLVLSDVDETRGGTLWVLTGDELSMFAQDVPSRGLIDLRRSVPRDVFGDAIASTTIDRADSVVHDFDGAIGVLSLIDSAGRLVRIARDVPLASATSYPTSVRGTDLAGQLEGTRILAFLEDFDPEARTGQLSVLLPDGSPLAIDEGVSSHTPGGDLDRPGLLYSIREGERRGAWFVRQ